MKRRSPGKGTDSPGGRILIPLDKELERSGLCTDSSERTDCMDLAVAKYLINFINQVLSSQLYLAGLLLKKGLIRQGLSAVGHVSEGVKAKGLNGAQDEM